VNALQGLRAGAGQLDKNLQQSLRKSVEAPYRVLAELLIQEGRLTEAEQVLAMLKEHEQFEFVRGDRTSDQPIIQATLSASEKALADRLLDNARTLTALYPELDVLERFKERSFEDRRKWEQAREQLAMESDRFDRALKEVEHLLAEQKKDERAKELASASSGALNEALAEVYEASKVRPAVVYFLPSENATTFLVNTKQGAFAVHGGIGEKQLNDLVARLRSGITRRDASYRENASQLYEALITPIEAQLKMAQVDSLMLYLVDALRYLPFAVLYDANEGKHLIEKYSLSMYTAAAHTGLKDLSAPKWSIAALGLSKAKPGFEALPSIEQELNRIVRDSREPESVGIINGNRYLDDAFTRQELIGLLNGNRRYAVMHLATHFKLAPGSEEESFLLLGDGDALTLKQIRTDQGIKLRGYDLVTLSACQTATGGGNKGVEVESMAVILQKKGAKSVLATLWSVQDSGTAQFMEEFYRSRGEERKTTKVGALRQAQLALLHGQVKSDNPTIDLTHPYYWAPFVLMGNSM
jgi:CHAT domain-containing protein